MSKVKYLDGVRGIAAFIVFIHHFTLAFMPLLFWGDPNRFEGESFKKLIHDTPIGIIINGNFAVCMFFVLSGFVLSYKFFLTGEAKIITSSAFRRYIRLGLPVFVSVMISYFILKAGGYFNKEVARMTGSKWFMDFWGFEPNLFSAIKNGLYGALIKGDNTYNSVLWTLKWELFGSFIVYSFLMIFGKSPKRHLAYIISVFLAWDSYYLAFILGMMICDIHVNKKWLSIKNKFILYTLLIVGVYIGSTPVDYTQNIGYKYLYPDIIMNQFFVLSHIIGAFLIIVFTLNSSRLQKLLSTKPFTFLGDISYSLYLLHLLVIGSFSAYLFKTLILSNISYKLSYTLTLLVTTILIFFLSYFYHRFVDRRSIELSKRFFMD
ncbi:acyltransferase family protein [Paenibacillus elgii]|uniref:acyltransferase family protein n=1 Tax=Paenibacillus elgii TaxID=189691 RepID=UPI00203EAE6C|nr:acyltransferase [Paenibacillus elgii]MCM3272351.1 acyltransferase [Paenibacillus elgii]